MKRYALTLIVGIVLVGCAEQTSGQWPPPVFEVYTTETTDGLASNGVYQVFVDNGTKWFATGRGLTLFDERIWVNLPEWVVDGVEDIKRDPSGEIWVACDSGPRRYREGVFESPLPPPPFDTDGMATALEFDPLGQIWVGSVDVLGWFDLLHPDLGWRSYDLRRDPLLPPYQNGVQLLRADPRDGSIWMLTWSHLLRTEDQGEAWQRVWWEPLATNNRHKLDFSPDGRAWFLDYGWAWVSENLSDGWTRVDHPVFAISPSGYALPCLFCITVVGDEGIWFGTNSPIGAFWYDYERWTWFDWSTSFDPLPWIPRVVDVAVDPLTGDAWFGTNGAGVGVLRGWRLPPPPPVLVGLSVTGGESDGDAPPRFSENGQMSVLLDFTSEQELTVDLYLALELPQGEILFWPALQATWVPFIPGIRLSSGTSVVAYELLSLTLPDLTAGTYRWYAACTDAGTMEFASNIASCEWEFE